jgi:hypothetical protein
MNQRALTTQLPWLNRWATPTLAQLVDPLKVQDRKVFQFYMEQIECYPGLNKTIVWYGPAWKWTVRYSLSPQAIAAIEHYRATHHHHHEPAPGEPATPPKRTGKLTPIPAPAAGTADATATQEALTVCYLVPRLEGPLVCVPLSEQTIADLPFARLARFIKDGIRVAKCAVTIHWATWTPNNQTEVGLLMDLLKRCHKLPPLPKGHKTKA